MQYTLSESRRWTEGRPLLHGYAATFWTSHKSPRPTELKLDFRGGTFADGLPHGEFSHLAAGGATVRSTWENGLLKRGKVDSAGQSFDGDFAFENEMLVFKAGKFCDAQDNVYQSSDWQSSAVIGQVRGRDGGHYEGGLSLLIRKSGPEGGDKALFLCKREGFGAQTSSDGTTIQGMWRGDEKTQE